MCLCPANIFSGSWILPRAPFHFISPYTLVTGSICIPYSVSPNVLHAICKQVAWQYPEWSEVLQRPKWSEVLQRPRIPPKIAIPLKGPAGKPMRAPPLSGDNLRHSPSIANPTLILSVNPQQHPFRPFAVIPSSRHFQSRLILLPRILCTVTSVLFAL